MALLLCISFGGSEAHVGPADEDGLLFSQFFFLLLRNFFFLLLSKYFFSVPLRARPAGRRPSSRPDPQRLR